MRQFVKTTYDMINASTKAFDSSKCGGPTPRGGTDSKLQIPRHVDPATHPATHPPHDPMEEEFHVESMWDIGFLREELQQADPV